MTSPIPVGDISPEEAQAIFEKLAQKIVHWRLSVPAILFLESVRPLNVVGVHLYLFFQPLLGAIFSFPEGEKFAQLMMKRENVEYFLDLLETLEQTRGS